MSDESPKARQRVKRRRVVLFHVDDIVEAARLGPRAANPRMTELELEHEMTFGTITLKRIQVYVRPFTGSMT